jgi:hypothetical protein
LIARAARSPTNADLQEVVTKAKEKFRGRAGRIEVECTESCALEVDGHSLDPDADRWVASGPHVAVLTSDAHPGYRDEHPIEIVPLETTRVHFVPRPMPAVVLPPTPQPSPSAAPHTGDGGISPAWFWLGAGITVALAGATTISGFDVSSRRTAFENGQCPAVGSDACDQRSNDGREAVTRTNVLLAATAATGAATVATIFLVRWKPTMTTSVAATGDSARMTLTGRF